MPAFPILDLAIGLSFVYLLLSLLCTTLNEMIASWFKLRSKTLQKGIERMLGDSNLTTKLYQQPLIRSLARNDQTPPSYIPSSKFAIALKDVLSEENQGNVPPDTTAGITKTNPALRETVEAVLADTSTNLVNDQQKIEAWFDDSMDRVSGWYKRDAQARALLLAVLITLFLNADTLRITQTLWTHPAMTAVVVETAKERVGKGRPGEETAAMVTYDKANDPTASSPKMLPSNDAITPEENKLLGQITGWGNDWLPEWQKTPTNSGRGFSDWLVFLLRNRLLGWIITALAVSMGAPFWFDTLNRFMNIRNAGRAPDEPRDKSQPSQEDQSGLTAQRGGAR